MLKKWFFIGSFVLLMWGIINTWFGISRYGIGQGMYVWFCNLALFAVAYAIWRKNTSWLIAWLSFALLTQTFWIVDNIWRIITGKNLFGLVEFMYQPGYPLDEFLFSHYHYFIIPSILFALLFIKQKKSHAKIIALIQGMFIFGISYFLFPPEQNLNCIREPCFIISDKWKGHFYSLTFSLTVILLGAIGSHLIERIHKKITFTKKHKAIATFIFFVIILISIGLIIVDVNYKRTLPKFICSEGFEDSEIKISCGFSTEFEDEKMWFVYNIENKSPKYLTCTSRLNMDGMEQIMHQSLYLEPLKKYNFGFIIPYPNKDTIAKVSALCH